MTKIALVVTTIHVPTVLALYRKLATTTFNDVAIFVAGDLKTPHTDVIKLCDAIGAKYLTPAIQVDYACSDLLGWDTDARRNIATLEALKWGADLFVFVDDDNVPLNSRFFPELESLFVEPFTGLQIDSTSWVDANNLLSPACRQRGIPPDKLRDWSIAPAIDKPVGVVQATILGDPDIAAIDRLGFPQPTWSASDILRAGFIVDLARSRTVFNTQATCLIRELVPAMFIWPGSGTTTGIGRNADIYASLITQRIMRETTHVIHFGKPLVLQQRNQHNLIRDLKSEIFAMEHIEEFAAWLDGCCLASSVLGNVRYLYYAMAKELPWLPKGVSEAGLAWCDDCEKAL